MPTFDLPDGVRSTLHQQLRNRGWLEAACRGRDGLKTAAAATAFTAVVLATITTYMTSIVDEPDTSLDHS